jgi:hypothetical protein
MARRPKPWAERSERSRKRLVGWGKRKGFSEEETKAYVESGGSTSDAYGHKTRARGERSAESKRLEKVHRRQRYLLNTYGSKNKRDAPYLDLDDLKEAREELGEEWVTERLEQLRRDRIQWTKGRFPHRGDDEYSRVSQIGHNPDFAAWYWYHTQ